MTTTLHDIRDRIHKKSEHYFTFAYNRRGAQAWRMFYGATDALLDASMAATAFEKAVRSDPAVDLLLCYGFLQALYIQQDAVLTLSRSVNLAWHPNDDARLKEIRDLRNRLTGHPALAGEKEKPPRLSSAIIGYHEVTATSFSGHIYVEEGSEQVQVHVPSILTDNECRLAAQMLVIEAEMDNRERQFRTSQARKAFGDVFDTGFDYLVQRLRPELDDEGRVGQALSHISMIHERLSKLNQELADRELMSGSFSCELSSVFDGIDFLEKLITESDRSPKSQNQIDIVCDGLRVNINKLRKQVAELDGKLNEPI